MEDETGTAPVVALSALTGELLAIAATEPKSWARVDVAEIAAIATLASTALQPGDVGSAAGLSVEDVQGMIDTSFAGIDALLGELVN